MSVENFFLAGGGGFQFDYRVQAIRYALNDGGLQGRTADGSPDDILAVAREERTAPEVLLLCAGDGPQSDGGNSGFSLLKERLNFREAQNKAKTLSACLLGKKGIPAVRAKYARPQTCLNAVGKLLANAGSIEGEEKAFIVFVDLKLFAGLYCSAATGSSSPASSAPRRKFRNLRVLDEQMCQEVLLDRIEPLVPEKLKAWYLGRSPQIDLVRRLILRAGLVDYPLLILGESGTGKERIARAVYDYGRAGKQILVVANCAAIPSEMLESELFGHVRGAFTGAACDRPGLWRHAKDGTLFLDEIGDLTLAQQAKVLRALQENKVRPVGSEKEYEARVRIIAATNRDLRTMIQAGTFREDLYYRLCSVIIHAPALREHRQDIPLLVASFWRDITLDPAARLPRDILVELQQLDWPGNVREVRAFLQHLFAIGGKDNVDLALARTLLYQRRAPTRN